MFCDTDAINVAPNNVDIALCTTTTLFFLIYAKYEIKYNIEEVLFDSH